RGERVAADRAEPVRKAHAEALDEGRPGERGRGHAGRQRDEAARAHHLVERDARGVEGGGERAGAERERRRVADEAAELPALATRQQPADEQAAQGERDEGEGGGRARVRLPVERRGGEGAARGRDRQYA